MSTGRPTLSIVTTLYNSATTIEEFCRRATAAAEVVTPNFEIVIVDDGSPDASLAIAARLALADSRLKVVELSRNFGHHKALMTGLQYASGEYCFLIDSDLEEAPELIARFWETLHSSKMDVVYGFQTARAGSLGRRVSGALAYFLINALIPQRIPFNHITVRLMRRAYVDSLLLHREQQTVIGGLWVITGYKQLGIPVDKLRRDGSEYSLWRRWHALIDSITSFSEVPLVAIFYLGIFISMLALVVGIVLIAIKLMRGQEVEGWISVMLSVWFLGGLAILCIGTTGIYVSKIFIETKRRPYTIVRAVHGAASADATPRLPERFA